MASLPCTVKLIEREESVINALVKSPYTGPQRPDYTGERIGLITCLNFWGGNVTKYSYGWEKLHMAVHSLAGQGTQKERLIGAVAYSLIHIRPENDLPEEMHVEFNEFMRSITSVAAKGNEGSIQATVNTLDEVDINRAVEKIISFYDTVCRQIDAH